MSATRPANTETIAGTFGARHSATRSTCCSVMIAVTLTIDAGIRQRANHRAGERALGGGDRNLHVDVCAPRRDHAALRDHLVEIVGENLERDRPVRNGFDKSRAKAS